jgi:hypothetical protein
MSDSVDSAQRFEELGRFLQNQLDVFELGFGLGAQFHTALLTIFGASAGVISGLALIALAWTTLGKSVGARVNPGDTLRSIALATALLAPVPYSLDDNPVAPVATESFNELIMGETSEYYVLKTSNTVWVSGVTILMHKAASAFNALIVGVVDKVLDGESGRAPLWVFDVLNRNYTDTMKQSGSLIASVGDYRTYCTSASARPDGASVPDNVWRAYGLRGGFYHSSMLQGAGDSCGLLADASNFSLSCLPDSFLQLAKSWMLPEHAVQAEKALASMNISVMLRQNRPDGYQVLNKGAWGLIFSGKGNSVASTFLPRPPADKSNSRFEPTPLYGSKYIAQISGTPATADPSTGAAVLDSNRWFPKTCLDMFIMNQRAFEQMKLGAEGVNRSLIPEHTNANATAAVELTTSATISMAQSVLMNEIHGRGLRNKLNHLPERVRATVFGKGITLHTWLEKLSLEQNIPLVIGSLSFAYALAVAIYPVIIAVSILPGRAAMAAVYFKFVAFVFTVTVLTYIILRIGTAIMMGVMTQFQNAARSNEELAVNTLSLALSIEASILAGIAGSFALGWFLVFSDMQALRQSGSKMVDGTTGTKTAAAAAATAVMTASVVGRAAKAAGIAAKVTKPAATAASGSARSSLGAGELREQSQNRANKVSATYSAHVRSSGNTDITKGWRLEPIKPKSENKEK